MKEIKFRAWDKKSKLFIYGWLDGTDFVVSVNPDFSEHEWDGLPLDEMELEQWEQYTGLKDKNGKEICDGDIIRFSVKAKKHDWYTVVVTWDEIEAGWMFGKFIPCDFSGERTDHQVIGNVWENPELIHKEA